MPSATIDVKKLTKRIDKIKNIINDQGEYGYYLINNDNVKLVSKGDDKKKAKKEFLKKIKGKERYVGDTVYEVKVVIKEKYIKKTSDLVAGPVSLLIKEFMISESFKLKYEADYKYGSVWYTNSDLLRGKFRFGDIKKIVKAIDDHNINIIGAGQVRAVDVLN